MSHRKPLEKHHYEPAHTAREINPSDKFKELFVQRMMEYKEDISSRVSEKDFQPTWRDKLALGSVSVITVAGTSAIAILATASLITAAASGGATLAVAIVAIVAAEGYNIYRAKQKQKQYRRAVDFLNHDDIEEEFNQIADILADMYKVQLENCTPEHAAKLAHACFKPIKHQIQTNKLLKFHELLNPGKLQALLMKSANHAPKSKINIDGENGNDCNTQSAIVRAAIYCEESGRYYVSEKSKPEKYGVISFKTKRDMEDFKLLIGKYKHDDKKWMYQRMAPAQLKKYYQSGLFSPPVNDKEMSPKLREKADHRSEMDDSSSVDRRSSEHEKERVNVSEHAAEEIREVHNNPMYKGR